MASLTLLLIVSNSLGLASATGRTHADQSLEYLLQRTASSRPPEADPDVDCMWRKLAMRYAPKLQPWLDKKHLSMLHDALELSTLCGETFVAPTSTTNANTPITAATNSTTKQVFVDPVKGSDSNTGSIAQPLKTIPAGIRSCRAVLQVLGCEVLLREGTHYLDATVTITQQDSGLRIAAYNGESAVVSGGKKLTGLQWKTDPKRPGVFVTSLAQHAKDLPRGVPALRHQGLRATLARYPNANPEIDIFPKGYITEATQWGAPKFHGKVCDPNKLCGESETQVVPVPLSQAWHGMYQNWTVGVGGNCEKYDPPLSPWCSDEFYLLRQFPEMHTRAPSSLQYSGHLPNAPYKHPEGSRVHAWRPGHWYTWMFEIGNESTPPKEVNDWTVYQDTNAVYGQVPCPKCSNDKIKYLGEFQTQEGCWGACNATDACYGWTWHSTTFDPSFAKQCYGLTTKNWGPQSQGAVVSGRGPHTEGGEYEFSAGGTQGGEGNEQAGEWFLEGALEELDADNEFFYDAETQLLHFYLNGTGSPDSEVVVPTLATLFDFVGSQSQPLRNVSVEGITFTETRPTFMEPRGQPSGGDWSLERSGALRLEGTESLLVKDCLFVRLDSNAISINGYNRHATIDHNEFVWLGQNAIASWGKAEKNDGRNGAQPHYNTVTNNFCHEIGHIQKQSSFYFQAETTLATIENNIVFNIPRAAINFNDGFGGGAEIQHNLLFNTCRESGDHGAFNSWDRLPYITTIRDGTPSTIPKRNNVHNNFIVANYAADGGCLDNDDGSSYYDIHHNFCMFGGHKQNFDGHSKRSFGNIHVHPQVYGTKCIDEESEGQQTHTSGPHGLPPAGYAEEYTDNICILPSAGSPYMVSAGSLRDRKDFQKGMVLRNNTIYIPGGDSHTAVSVGGQQISFAEFQKEGFDPSSQLIAGSPSLDQIVAWAEPLLGLSPQKVQLVI